MKAEVTIPEGYRRVAPTEPICFDDEVITAQWNRCMIRGPLASEYPESIFIRPINVTPDLKLDDKGIPYVPSGFRPLGAGERHERGDIAWVPGITKDKWHVVSSLSWGRVAYDEGTNPGTIYLRPQ